MAKSPSIDVNLGEMAGELSFVLGYKFPLGVFIRLSPLNAQSADFIAPEFEPEHLTSHIYIEVILHCIGSEQFSLGHQIGLGLL